MPLGGPRPTWFFKEFEGMELDIVIHGKEKKEEVIEARELFQALDLINDLTEKWYTSESFAQTFSRQAFRKIMEEVITLVTDARKHEDRIEKLGKMGIKLINAPRMEEMRWLDYAEHIKERLKRLIARLVKIRDASESQIWPYAEIDGRDIEVKQAVSGVIHELAPLSNAVRYSFRLGEKLGILPHL